MQGGLAEGTAPHEYAATATAASGQPSTTSTSTQDREAADSRIGAWLSSINISGEDIFLLSALLNLLAAGTMVIGVLV